MNRTSTDLSDNILPPNDRLQPQYTHTFATSNNTDPNENHQARQRQKKLAKKKRLLDAKREVNRKISKLLSENEGGRVDNPLQFLSSSDLHDRIEQRFERWAFDKHALDLSVFQRAGRVAARPDDYLAVPNLTSAESRALRLEASATFWDETRLRVPIALACTAALVQGFVQSAAVGANLFYPFALGMAAEGHAAQLAERWKWLFAVQNAVPWFSGAVFGAGLSDPLQEYFFGRRGAMFVAGLLTFVSVVGAAFSQNKWQLLAFRILLGLGMGAKASVVPVYAAEVSPAKMRGRLVINWQVFNALGIFLAFTMNLILANDRHTGWRLMFGAGILPTIPMIALVFVCPESPRFLMKRGQYIDAYNSFLRLRGAPIIAARDMIYLDAQLEAAEAQIIDWHRYQSDFDEEDQNEKSENTYPDYTEDVEDFVGDSTSTKEEEEEKEEKKRTLVGNSPIRLWWYNTWNFGPDGPRGFRQRLAAWLRTVAKGGEPAKGHIDPFVHLFRKTGFFSRAWNLLFAHPRVKRASAAAMIVMLSQQLCGINILAFYSADLFEIQNQPSASLPSDPATLGLNDIPLTPLWYSWGFGIVNFLFSLPAYGLVDKRGRRWLLLWTFPFMAIFLLITGFTYGPVPKLSYATILIFTAFYSVGGGPVPFAYCAEIFPLANREAGMSFAVFWNFLGAGILSLFVPRLFPSPRTLLGIFSGLCILAWILMFLFMPETKQCTLEDINYIFGVTTNVHAKYHAEEVAPHAIKTFFYKIGLKKTKPAHLRELYRWSEDQQ